MERNATIEEAKEIMGSNFIGIDELKSIQDRFPVFISDLIPEITYKIEELISKKSEYILILGVTHMQNGEQINLLTLRNYFGTDPYISEPC